MNAQSKQPQRWRGTLAVVLLVLGGLLTPVSIVAGWARVVLTDTPAVTAALAPLAADPGVQEFLAAQVAGAINERVDVDSIIDGLVGGLAEAVPSRAARAALQALRQSAVEGVRGSIDRAVAGMVESAAFTNLWEQSVRISHQELTAALAGDPDANLTIDEAGLGLQLGLIINQVRDRLIAQGHSYLRLVPDIDKTVVLIPTGQLLGAQTAYQGAVAVGGWLWAVALGLLLAGVLVARRRLRALGWAMVSAGVGAALLLLGMGLGRQLLLNQVPAEVASPAVVELFHHTLTSGLANSAWLVLGVAVVGLLGVLVGLRADTWRLRP